MGGNLRLDVVMSLFGEQVGIDNGGVPGVPYAFRVR